MAAVLCTIPVRELRFELRPRRQAHHLRPACHRALLRARQARRTERPSRRRRPRADRPRVRADPHAGAGVEGRGPPAHRARPPRRLVAAHRRRHRPAADCLRLSRRRVLRAYHPEQGRLLRPAARPPRRQPPRRGVPTRAAPRSDPQLWHLPQPDSGAPRTAHRGCATPSTGSGQRATKRGPHWLCRPLQGADGSRQWSSPLGRRRARPLAVLKLPPHMR
jgi:hypothetical protein